MISRLKFCTSTTNLLLRLCLWKWEEMVRIPVGVGRDVQDHQCECLEEQVGLVVIPPAAGSIGQTVCRSGQNSLGFLQDSWN